MSENDKVEWSLSSLTLGDFEAAWRRVSDNDGCAGVDGVTVGEFASHLRSILPELFQQVVAEAYRCLPFRQIVIEKAPGSGQTRTLLVPAVRDRIVQTTVARALSHDWDQDFLSASYAYRPGLGVDSAVGQVLAWRDQGWTWVANADIQSYFDSVSHPGIERMISEAGVAL
jgi:retron-type reverse transcriptase